MGHSGDVEAARGDVCGHQDAQPPRTEAGHHFLALGLCHVAVDGLGVVAAAAQPDYQPVHADLGAPEHQRLRDAAGLVQERFQSGVAVRSETS